MAVLLWLLVLQHSCAMSTQRHIAAGNLVTLPTLMLVLPIQNRKRRRGTTRRVNELGR